MINFATFDRISINDVWAEISYQVNKHGEQAYPNLPASDPRWLPILVEEVGETATEVAHDDPETVNTALREELVQVAAVAIAWIVAIDRENEADRG